jgi:PKD repeat protein
VETPVQIGGSGFLAEPAVRLGETWLLSPTLVSSTTLAAVVPAGMWPGTYTLTLVNGDCQEVVRPNAFTVTAGPCISPAVTLASDGPVELGQAVHLTATVVTGTAPFFYAWDMGGPGMGIGLGTATPTFTYTAFGAFTATVTLTNYFGADAVSVPVLVRCTTPTVTVTNDGPVELGQPLYLTATATGPGPFTYTWDLGDGSGIRYGANVSYTYAMAGAYTVTLTVTSPCGTAVVTAPVAVLPPVEWYHIYLPVVLRE